MNHESNSKCRYFDDVHLSDAEFSSGKQHVQFFMKNHPITIKRDVGFATQATRSYVKIFSRLKKIKFLIKRQTATSL